MKKITPLIAAGVILLFLGLSVSPIVAETQPKETITITYIDDDYSVSVHTLTLTDDELQELNQILSELLEKIQEAPDYETALSIIDQYIIRNLRNQKLATIFGLLTKTIFDSRQTFRFSPFRKNVIVMSSGFTNRMILPLPRGTQASMYRFLTGWHYSPNSNLFINSITTIISPYPFYIDTLTGRQVGLMRGFVGLYITQHSTIANKDHTYFIGYARSVVGFDF